MVYEGKPSKGCQMCRTRRIKCDETKPTCTQCHKSRRTCPGYKDDFDLMFRNETQATEKRARRTAAVKKVLAQTAPSNNHAPAPKFKGGFVEPEGSAATSFIHQASTARALIPALAIPVEQQAPCYFMSNFVLHPKSETSRGYFDFLAPVIKQEPSESPLSLAFSAVALASLANRPQARASRLRFQAVEQYGRALGALSVALQHPVQQKSDQTLAAIMMLGFYETVTSERTNIMAWGSHITGAVQLIKLRGRKQFRTKIGHALFVALRSQMIIQCFSASKPPMGGDMEWWVSDAAKDEIGTFVTKLNLMAAELRAEANTLASYPRTPENFPKAHALIARAQAMENDYQAWEDSLPENWRVKTVAWVDHVPGGDITKADVCPGKVDIYDDIWIANVYNHARVSRLFVAGVIVRCAAWVCYPVDYRTTPEYASAARLCVGIVADVLGSIPYHLGWRLSQQGTLTAGDFTGFAEGKGDITSAKALGGFFCIWPLFAVSCLDYTSDSQRQWIQGRLIWISETMGLNQAKVLSTLQLRAPSMTIRRDNLGHSPPAASISSSSSSSSLANPAAAAALQAKAAAMLKSGQAITPAMIAAYMAKMQAATAGAPAAMPIQASDTAAAPVVDPLHALQREAWERERKSLLAKAGNGSEKNVEMILAQYLAV